MQKMNQAGLDLVKHFEGCELTAYKCPADVPTIGYGHTQTVTEDDVINKTMITEGTAETLLRADLKEAEEAVERLVTVSLTENQFSSLVSWTFNLGQGNLASSTMLKRINEGNFAAVPFEMKRWDKAGGRKLAGLTKRRTAEAKLFEDDIRAITGNNTKKKIMG